jgi:hypothetical protein
LSEKLDRLISLYDSKATDDVAKATDRFNEFKAKRSEMVEIDHPYSASVGDVKFSTVGEVFGAAIPESGSLNDVIYRNIVPSIFGIDSKYREVFDDVRTLRTSVGQLQRANKIKEKGGEKYLDELMRSIGSLILDVQSRGGSKFDFSRIVEDGPEEFSRVLNRIDDLPDAPRGIRSSLELFDAVVESGDPIGELEAASSINENEAGELEEPQIEEVAPLSEAESEVASSAPEIEEELQPLPPALEEETVEAVPASTVSPLNENEEIDAESIEETETISQIPEEVESRPAELERETIVSPLNEAPVVSLEEAQPVAAESPIVENISQSSTSEDFEYNTMNDFISNFISTAGASNVFSLDNFLFGGVDNRVSEESESTNTSNFNSILGGDTVGNFMNMSEESIFNNLLGTFEGSMPMFGDLSTVEGSMPMFGDLSTVESSVSSISNLNSLEYVNPSVSQTNMLESTSNPIEISKEEVKMLDKSPMFPQPPSNILQQPTSTSTVGEYTNVFDTSSQSKNESVSNTSNTEQVSSSIDLSGVEARLRRIENLLSSPLEVKMIEE